MDGPNPAAGAAPLTSAVSVTGEGDPTASAKPGIDGTGGTRRLEEAGASGLASTLVSEAIGAGDSEESIPTVPRPRFDREAPCLPQVRP